MKSPRDELEQYLDGLMKNDIKKLQRKCGDIEIQLANRFFDMVKELRSDTETKFDGLNYIVNKNKANLSITN